MINPSKQSPKTSSLRPAIDPLGTIDDCRLCGQEAFLVIDLGLHPFANMFLPSPDSLVEKYPLRLLVCPRCSTAQLSYCADDKNLYEQYNYITPKSQALNKHYANIYEFLKKNDYIKDTARILEIGSNIGRFLEFIKPHVKNIIGVDPAINIAQMANAKGIPTINDFFNKKTAAKIFKNNGPMDLILARHCFAHNEKPWLMLEGIETLLSKDGIFLVENAYFLDTVINREFDQIYHEHMYYYTLRSIQKMLKNYSLMLVDAMHSSIHGGTMLYVIKRRSPTASLSETAAAFLDKEKQMHTLEFYKDFVESIEKNKILLVKTIQSLIRQNATIHAYGACAKSSTLLNYYGITNRDVPFIVDSTPIKQGKYIPQADIKVISEEEAKNNPPDYYLLTIWNYKDEIIKKIRGWGNTKTKFILPHPEVEIIN